MQSIGAALDPRANAARSVNAMKGLTQQSSQLLNMVSESVGDIVAPKEVARNKSVAVSAKFQSSFSLSFSMGFFITLFFVPAIWLDPNQLVFGYSLHGSGVADENLSWFVYWFGHDIPGFWPNVVQLMFFTVYGSSGTTCQLAWQGMMGTIMAELNVRLMFFIFPLGGACWQQAGLEANVKGYAINTTATPIGRGMRPSCEWYQGDAGEFDVAGKFVPDISLISSEGFYHQFFWITWVDTFLFILLFLSSGAQENTMKFGLSWHMYYMMQFMSFNPTSQSPAVLTTSFIGVFLAILVTLVPNFPKLFSEGAFEMPLMKTPKLSSNGQDLLHQSERIVVQAVHFMSHSAEMHRDQRCQRRFAIEEMVDDAQALIPVMNANLAESWWESYFYKLTCATMWYYKVRTYCQSMSQFFCDDIGTADDVMFNFKKAVQSEHASNYDYLTAEERKIIISERKNIQEKLFAHCAVVSEIFQHISDIFDKVSDHETEGEEDDLDKLDEFTEELKTKLNVTSKQLLEIYRQTVMKNRKRDAEISESTALKQLRDSMMMVIFSLDCIGKQLVNQVKPTDFKENKKLMPGANDMYNMMSSGGGTSTFCKSLMTAFKNTWFVVENGKIKGPVILRSLPCKYLDKDRASFVWRNFFVLCLLFTLGNLMWGNVFTPFSDKMAGTLSLLISHFPGSAFYMNIMRLLGITLGKALPIVLSLVVSAVPIGWGQSLWHSILVFFYCWFFSMMYYSSPMWGTVGMCIVAFGCYSLAGVEVHNATSDSVFANLYKEIGTVTVAMLVQIFVDTFVTSFNNELPKQRVTRNMALIGVKIGDDFCDDEDDVINGTVIKSFEAFFAKDFDKLKANIVLSKATLGSQTAMVTEMDDRTVIVAGSHTGMPGVSLLSKVFVQIDVILDNMEVLVAVHSYTKSECRGKADWHESFNEAFEKDLMDCAIKTFIMLQLVVDNDTEGMEAFIDHGKVVAEDETDGEKGARSRAKYNLYSEDAATGLCIAVAARALRDAEMAMYEIQHLCFMEGEFPIKMISEPS